MRIARRALRLRPAELPAMPAARAGVAADAHSGGDRPAASMPGLRRVPGERGAGTPRYVHYGAHRKRVEMWAATAPEAANEAS